MGRNTSTFPLILMADRAEFERVAPWLAQALHHAGDTHKLEDVWALIASGDALLWTTPRSAVVTQIVVFPRRRVLDVWLAGSALGGLSEVLGLLPAAEAWARERGIVEVILTGRLGWSKVLRHLGFSEQAIIVKKNI